MSVKGTKSGSEQGFSMVELLVIMAIIAIVMMLLLPALQRAKNKGLDIVCMSNLMQFGKAGHMYWGDNDGRAFPYRDEQLEDGDVYWFGWLQRGPKGSVVLIRRRALCTSTSLAQEWRFVPDWILSTTDLN